MAEQTLEKPEEVIAPQVQENITPRTDMAAAPVTLESVSADLGVPVAPKPQVTPQKVYSADNIARAASSPTPAPDFEKMSVDKLAKEIANARNQAELEQIAIKNRPVRESVNIGEGAHLARLRTANINALSGLLGAKEAQLARENEEDLLFMQTYGADPSQRPKGMSKGEFAQALNAGQFQELLTPEFKEARKKAAGSGSGLKIPEGGSVAVVAVNDAVANVGDDWSAVAQYLQNKGYDTGTGSEIDLELNKRYNPENYQKMLEESKLTATERKEQVANEQEQREAADTAKTAIDLANQLSGHSGLKTSVGLKGFRGGLLGGKVIPGTAAADFVAKADKLKNLLTLENLDKMSGVLSETDIKILSSAATELDRSQSERDFKETLNEIQTRLQNKLGGGDMGSRYLSDEDAYQEYLRILNQ